MVPNKGKQNQKRLRHPCLLGGPKEGENATSPLHSRGIPNKGEQNQNWLPHPCILGDSQRQSRGAKSKVATSPLPSWGPKRGRKCYVNPAFLGIPNKGEQNQNWLLQPCLLGGPKEGENATSPQHSRVSPIKGNKIKTGYLTHAFSGAQKRAKMLCHPCIRGDPQRQARGAKSERVPNKGEQNQKWLPQPCLLRGPKEGGNATSPLRSQGSPNRGSKRALTGPVEKSPSRPRQFRHGVLDSSG